MRAGIIACVYAALSALPPFNSISYGPVQVRVAEALTVLPYVAPYTMWGLYLGCIIANLASPFLVWDLTLGALTTLLAGYLTSRAPRTLLAPLPPVILNAIVVSYYVARLSDISYFLCAIYIGAGELLACYAIGYPLLKFILSSKKLQELIKG